METYEFDVEGHIDLVVLSETIEPTQTSKATEAVRERARLSRVNDVMIVLERERHRLENALRRKLEEQGLPAPRQLELIIDDHAPRFRVSVSYEPDTPGAQKHPLAAARTLVENAVAGELIQVIEERKAHVGAPRWKAVVTTSQPDDAEAKSSGDNRAPCAQRRKRSIWLKALLLLLATVIVAVAYLYAAAQPT